MLVFGIHPEPIKMAPLVKGFQKNTSMNSKLLFALSVSTADAQLGVGTF